MPGQLKSTFFAASLFLTSVHLEFLLMPKLANFLYKTHNKECLLVCLYSISLNVQPFSLLLFLFPASGNFTDPAGNNTAGEVFKKMIPVMLNRTIQRTPTDCEEGHCFISTISTN